MFNVKGIEYYHIGLSPTRLIIWSVDAYIGRYIIQNIVVLTVK